MRWLARCLFLLTLVPICFAQMSGPDMGDEEPPLMQMNAPSFTGFLERRLTSGTDAEPISTPVEMLMSVKGSWTFMFHGEAFLSDIQRGGQIILDELVYADGAAQAWKGNTYAAHDAQC